MLDIISGLKRARKSNNILQKDVAKMLEIPLRTYQSYEYGEALPDIKTLVKIADYFGISVDYLIGRSDDPRRL